MKDKRLAKVKREINSLEKTINQVKRNLEKIRTIISKQKPKGKRKSQTG